MKNVETITLTITYVRLDETAERTFVARVARPATDEWVDFADEATDRLDAHVREVLGWDDYEVLEIV